MVTRCLTDRSSGSWNRIQSGRDQRKRSASIACMGATWQSRRCACRRNRSIMTATGFPVMKEQRQAHPVQPYVGRRVFHLIDWVDTADRPRQDGCDRSKERHLGCNDSQLLIRTRRNATTETGAAIDAASAVSRTSGGRFCWGFR